MEYDHNIGEFVNRARVAYAQPLRDFHDYPKMVMADDGRLVIVYTDSPATLHVTKARDPHTSFGVWDNNQINSDNPSYPCLIKASNGDLYTFYRSLKSPTDYRPLHYVKSTDHGESWSEPRVAIDSLGLPVNGDPQNLNEVYSGCPRHEPATEYYQERFSMGWTIAGGGPGQVAHNFYHKNAHFAYFYPGKDTFAAVDGTDLGDFIDYDEFKQVEIFDSGPLDYENRRIVDYYFAPSTLDEVGNPIVVFNFNRTLLAGRWTGAHWEHSVVLEDAAYNCFDIEKLGHDTFRVFAAQGSVLVIFSHDGGKTWQREHLVTPAEGLVSKVIRVQNAHPDIQLVAHENDWSVYHSDADKEVNYIGTFRVWTMKEVFVNPVAHPYYPSTTSTGENDSLNPFYSSTTIANNGTATDVASQLQYLKDPEPDFDSNPTGDLFEEQEDTMWDVQHPSITPVPTPSSLPPPVLGYTVPPATTQGDIMEILEGSGDDPDVLEFVLNSPTSMPIEEEESKSNSQGEPPGPASHSYEYTTPPAATPGAVADIIGDNVGNRRRLSGKTTSNVGGYVKQGSSQNVHKDPYRSLAGSSMKTDFLHV
jgi:BNR repeat-containing family member